MENNMRYFAKNKEVLGYDDTQIDLINKAISEGYVEIQESEIPNYIHPTAKERKELFLQSFFKVEGYGYYRRIPKGYQSAIESINTAYNMCKENKGLPAGVLIFYEEPDFTKAEQCTEEWLIEHQIVLPAMSEAKFIQLYNLFITTWNQQEH